ncbi:hypothetical protein TWF694_009016 [Orbilia ellipsospora]|uniref:Uncharacterized protein n=1 Tax=Orbilia ellipsospora TaxID=2528407 RepID=A0AAV9XDP9_9PEZI
MCQTPPIVPLLFLLTPLKTSARWLEAIHWQITGIDKAGEFTHRPAGRTLWTDWDVPPGVYNKRNFRDPWDGDCSNDFVPAEAPDVFLGLVAYYGGNVNPNDPAYLLRVEIHEGEGCQDPDPLIIALDSDSGFGAHEVDGDALFRGGYMEIEDAETVLDNGEEDQEDIYDSEIQEEDALNLENPGQGNIPPATDFWNLYYDDLSEEEEEEESFLSPQINNNRLTKRAPPPSGSKQSQSLSHSFSGPKSPETNLENLREQQRNPFRRLNFDAEAGEYVPASEQPGYIESKFQNPKNAFEQEGYQAGWDPLQITSSITEEAEQSLINNQINKNDISPSVPSPKRIPAPRFEDLRVQLDNDVSIDDPQGLLGGNTHSQRRSTLKFLMNEGRHVPDSSTVDDQSASQNWYPGPPIESGPGTSAGHEYTGLFPIYKFEDPVSFRFVFDPYVIHDVAANV